MADLKKDLLNELVNRKYYSEIELIRLAQEPNMNYKKKIEEMVVVLQDIALLNSQINLWDKYFQEPQQQNVGVRINSKLFHKTDMYIRDKHMVNNIWN
jgi:hypothetical protein